MTRRCALAGALVALGLNFSAALAAPSGVTFFGAAGSVGGSSALVDREGYQVLVDCGSLYDEEPQGGRRQAGAVFGFDPKQVRDLILTHAHQDHAGRIPELVRAGFDGTVWMTEPTSNILAITGRGLVKYEREDRDWVWSEGRRRPRRTVHWRLDCPWAGRIADKHRNRFRGTYSQLAERISASGETAYAATCPTCEELELGSVMRHVRTVEFGRRVQVGPFAVTFSPTKHLPGAASVRFEDGEASWIFSGDLGTLRSCLNRTLEPAAKADVVFVETTSAVPREGEAQTAAEDERRRFRQALGAVTKAGGIAWIPAFALDRSQRILIEIAQAMAEGTVDPSVSVYYLSNSSRALAAAYVRHPEWFDVDLVTGMAPLLKRSKQRFEPKKHGKGPAILLTTSGMMDAASSYALLPELAPRADVTVFLVGYQSPGTCGFRLGAGARTLEVVTRGGRQQLDVGCTTERYGCFSGHATVSEIDAWLGNNLGSKLYLIHGERENLERRQQDLRSRLGADVQVPRSGERYPMTAKGAD